VPTRDITVLGNTGDDCEFYGVHVCPDLDIVTYTLAGIIDTEKGYGLAGDGTTVVDQLAELGHESWFRLGDRDFAYCLHRTLQLRRGVGLAATCQELCDTLGLETRILPMSEQPCPTLVRLSDGRSLHFEEYLVRERSPEAVESVDLGAAQSAQPGPGVLDALAQTRTIVVSPSNPVVSIAPILAVPGIRQAIERADAPVVAISPIVGGAPIKGPADLLLRGTGTEVSARGVARLYRDWIDGMVIDERDAELESDIQKLGLKTRVVDTLMVDTEVAGALARATLELAEELR
jgi:LPPG:FO 2-phospho-L-lactate transferase